MTSVYLGLDLEKDHIFLCFFNSKKKKKSRRPQKRKRAGTLNMWVLFTSPFNNHNHKFHSTSAESNGHFSCAYILDLGLGVVGIDRCHAWDHVCSFAGLLILLIFRYFCCVAGADREESEY